MKNYFKYFLPKILYGLALVLAGCVFVRATATGQLFFRVGKELELYLIGFAIFFLIFSIFSSFYEYHGFGSQKEVFRRGSNGPFVSITFDDGPSPKSTPQILDILKEKGVKATFFVTGKHVKKYPEIARRIVDEGHDIGNHTYNHKELAVSNRKTVLRELRKTDKAIWEATGRRTRLFRPPRGVCGSAARKILVEEGYKIILWTISTLDWRKVKPKTILWRIKVFIRDGAIILFHDSGSLFGCKVSERTNTVQALPLVIDFLKEEGYEIVTISEMFNGFEENGQKEEAWSKI
ncbi:polysaccharide deacetylase family protein [Candidatus Oleimmundimicrobium sp.]|uniref:polysaccharide deacetylase family protein n=1 Tax=Candidatus Oleimmundimicrobium sp. TaxID=3060597 RepID=UPI002716C16C|nr:polysaccharide deacetylase family protein [Candidatus Oleimmundimicrobium sp.]MDO8886935.1 polysaccharide deacetylase family protein [Candidatus Oleimmundimicrobium sp.]